MAVLSYARRYEGSTIRMAEFGDNKLIIDNRVLDSDLRPIHNYNSDLEGHSKMIATKKNMYIDRYVEGAVNVMYNVWPVMLDVSSRNPEFGSFTWSDPNIPNENYVITRPCGINTVWSDSKAGSIIIKKLNDQGMVISSFMYSGSIAYIVGTDDTNLYIIISRNYNYRLLFINRNVMTLTKEIELYNNYTIGDIGHHGSMSIIYRDSSQIAMIGPQGVFYFDTKNKNNYTVNACALGSGKKLPASVKNNSDYQTVVSNGYTVKMANGYHYGIDFTSNITDYILGTANMSWCAIKYDPDTYSYDCYPSAENTVTYNSTVTKDLKKSKLLNVTNLEYPYLNNRFLNYKVSDNKFLCLQTIDFKALTSIGKTYKPRWWIVEVNQNDPQKLTVLNAGELDYTYLSNIITYDGNKLLLCQELTAIHQYTVNTDTNTLDLTWNISAPNVCSVGLVNGVVWWINNATNELNYELEEETLTVDDKFEKTEVVIEKDPVINNYSISIRDKNKNRVIKKVRLKCNGAITFADNSTVMEIETFADKDLVVPITVTGSAENYIEVSIIQ